MNPCLSSWKMNINSKIGRKRSFPYEIKSSIPFIPIRRMCLWCPIMKRNKIITWIHDDPNWQMNFDFKKWWEVKFLLWNQSINSFILMRRMNLQCPINKRNKIIMWIRIYPNWKTIFNSKNGRKRSSSYETKASISFIPLRRMGLWFQIMKTIEIIKRIRVYPN